MFGKKKDEKIALGNLIDGLPVYPGSNFSIRLTPDQMAFLVESTK